MKRTFLFSILISLLFLPACAQLLVDQDFERRKAYVESCLNTSLYIKIIISQGTIIRGMTISEVIASWGRPYKINESVGSWGVHEQWCYGYWYYGWVPTYFLYFENGILDSWQNI